MFVNRIVPGLGLCVIIYDLVEIGDSFVLPGDGSSHTKVKFRFVVFRPFIGEVIQAKVSSSSIEGLELSVAFFEDIFIPADRLPQPAVFEQLEQVWYWEVQPEEGPPAKLYMDPGKVVRFRVIENIFKDVDPETARDEYSREKSYRIIGTLGETGLGCLPWWMPTDGSNKRKKKKKKKKRNKEGK
ncbi:unnamed protein product [Gongylonema pulchrum]|uniref:RNA_pol_Rbc25 domain-containing protein n=1 Tax=Gongylonema pulchrum TaxID=637853 RepID=A0A183DU03_9BILA|nr:unnamed protein product [Gongylonema pulchrum]